MKPFSRKIEKILAWIANVMMILMTALLSLGAFSGQLHTALKQPQLEPVLYNLVNDPAISSLLSSSGMDVVTLLVLIVRVYAVVAIVTLVLALIASFTMRARIVSGILFLIAALIIGFMTVGTLFPVYLLYLIVAVMLFARKAPKQEVEVTDYTNTADKPVVDKIEYL